MEFGVSTMSSATESGTSNAAMDSDKAATSWDPRAGESAASAQRREHDDLARGEQRGRDEHMTSGEHMVSREHAASGERDHRRAGKWARHPKMKQTLNPRLWRASMQSLHKERDKGSVRGGRWRRRTRRAMNAGTSQRGHTPWMRWH